jgi:hypothetical protein
MIYPLLMAQLPPSVDLICYVQLPNGSTQNLTKLCAEPSNQVNIVVENESSILPAGLAPNQQFSNRSETDLEPEIEEEEN